MPKSVIVIVGPIASGKGTVVEILKEKGYVPYSFSDRIKEEIKSRGMEITRFTLNQVSNDLRQTLGTNILAIRNAEKIDQENPELVVVDGARNPEEIKFLQEKYNAKVLGLSANQETRYERLRKRGLVNENLTLEQFKELDDRENNQKDEHAQQIGESIKLANEVLDNNGTIEDLKKEVNDFISSSQTEA
ncbi:MAG TPA: AAA family ATPase [Patescibacteria group bacterium]|nr:AAA family ATPase [Patescibacteria group bacterium]